MKKTAIFLFIVAILSCKDKAASLQLRTNQMAISEVSRKTAKLANCRGDTRIDNSYDKNGCANGNKAVGEFICEAGDKLFICGADAAEPCKELAAESSGK